MNIITSTIDKYLSRINRLYSENSLIGLVMRAEGGERERDREDNIPECKF